MRSFCLPAFLFIVSSVTAQNDKELVLVHAGNTFKETLTTEESYANPSFREGRVFFRDGGTSRAPLNHSILFDEMHFISKEGDTLAVMNEATIKLVTIGPDSFYYDKKGFSRLVNSINGVKLTQKEIWKIVDKQKIGAYGLRDDASSISSHTSYYVAGSFQKMIPAEDVFIRRVSEFWIGDRFNNFVKASKKMVLDHFSKNKEALKTFIETERINFEKKEDLKKLIAFISDNN